MGIDVQGLRFLLYAKSRGVDFARCAMIGRQGLHLTADAFKAVFAEFRFPISEQEADALFKTSGGYAEALLRHLGAEEIESFDFSSYEGASISHDMNTPIDERHKGRFSLVLDGGSLEHIFNFPQALKNCMEMVRVGGHYLGITPANNYFGHGFYQFSPDLFYSTFTRQNGFKMISMHAFEKSTELTTWYAVKAPQAVGQRITLCNSKPTLLLILATRTATVEIFAKTPQQSDYVAIWPEASVLETEHELEQPADGQREPEPRPPFVVRLARYVVPARVRAMLRQALSRQDVKELEFNPQFFKPVQPAGDLSGGLKAPVDPAKH